MPPAELGSLPLFTVPAGTPRRSAAPAQGVAQAYADHATREPQPAAATAAKPVITPEDAVAEIDR